METQMDELEDPSNYEFMVTPTGGQIHIVGTGLPTSMLVRGGREEGRYSEDEQKALCGVVSEFSPTDTVPTEFDEVVNQVCTQCRYQSEYIHDKGKFKNIPL